MIDNNLSAQGQNLPLLETNLAISSVMDLQELLTLISESAARLLAADSCVIFRLEAYDVTLCPMLAHGDTTEKSPDRSLKLGQGFTGYSVAINQPLMINDTLHDVRGFHVPATSFEEDERLLVTPMSFRGRVIGAMRVSRLGKPPFTEADFRLFVGFAAQAAVACENARLYQELENHVESLEEAVKARTAQIQQQSVWLEAILQTVQEAIVVTDCDGLIVHINPAALNILEISEQEALGEPLQHFVDPLTDEILPQHNRLQAVSQGNIQLGDKHYHYSVSPLSLGVDELEGYVFVLSDITPLHRLDALKTQMIRIAAHDLRSPITSLGLQCHLLKQSPDPLTERQNQIIESMKTSAHEMRDMINNLLDIERIERQASGSSEAVVMESLITSALSLLEVQFSQKQQRVTAEIPEDLPRICGDPVRLLEVIRNLLSNAQKYTPQGGQIHIRVYIHDSSLCVAVQDDGIGIDTEDLPHIFEARFRAKSALKSRAEGQGVGLSLVKTIIDEHSGRVWVTSQPGSGSIFSISLPVTQSCLNPTSVD